jgi:mannose-1-phosphate guanylyltransferase
MTVPVFLLAAGFGTRLRPLTEWLPKPLLPIGDRPAILHALQRVRPVASRIVANAHHRAADLRAFAAESASELVLSEEARILGTAGGLAHAAELLGEGDVLVWNGDIFADLDARRLVAAHEDAEAGATLAVRPLPVGEGNVGVDMQGRIVRLRAETVQPGEVVGGAFLGVHVVGERLRAKLPAEGCLVGDVYLPALRRGETLRAFEVTGGTWHDIGTLGDYQAACFAWLDATRGGSFVGPGATVRDGVTLRCCIVGAGATVEGAGELDRCIVWPGGRVIAPCSQRVVTPWGAVPFG